MKVAVIGAGNWGKNLVRNFHALGALGAVAEANPALAESHRSSYPDVPLFPDYRPLLDSDIAAVAVATPATTHHAVARDCLLAGKDVFVEKPLTLSAAEADDLANLAEQLGRILMVGHLLLYQPAIQWIRTYLKAGELGDIYSLHQDRLNLGTARAVENALWSLGVHDIAALLYLVGRSPDRIEVIGQPSQRPDVEDDIYLHLGFPGGTRAHLHASWLWPEKRRRLTVIGSKGMLVYEESEQKVILHRKGIGEDLRNRDEGEEVVFEGSSEPLKLELQHFLDCVNDRKPPISDGRNGVEVVRILEDASRQLEAR